MNRLIEIAAMCLGGVSLLAVSFLGFAFLTGAPLSEMAVVGKYFAEPEPTDAEKVKEEKREQRPPTKRETIDRHTSAMGLFDLPSPYSADELQSLESTLRDRIETLNARELDLDQRQEEIDAKSKQLAEQLETLLNMRDELELRQQSLDARSSEVARAELVKSKDDDGTATITAQFLADFEDQDRAKSLLTVYEDSAALILSKMDPDVASTTLSLMFAEDGEGKKFRKISEEYARLAADKGK